MDEIYKRLSDIPQKKRGMTALTLALIVSISWYFFSIRPLDAKIIGEQDRVRALKIKLSQRPKTLQKISNHEANTETQRSRKRRLSEQLPNQADIARLLKKIHERAQESELVISRFERGDTVLLDLYARIEVKMAFIGSYTQILSFINELSDAKGLDRIINIEQLKLSRQAGDSSQTSILSGSFLLVTFMSKSALSQSEGEKK